MNMSDLLYQIEGLGVEPDTAKAIVTVAFMAGVCAAAHRMVDRGCDAYSVIDLDSEAFRRVENNLVNA